MRQRDRFQRISHSRCFRSFTAQKLASRRNVVEERAHFNDGALPRRSRSRHSHDAAIDAEFRAFNRAALAGTQAKTRHAGNRGQRFTAKTQCAYRREIFTRAHLARCVRRNRERQFIARNSTTIVTHANEFRSTAFDFHENAARTSINCVLDEFLHHACRSLHHFACSDLIDEFRREHANRHLSARFLTRSEIVVRDRTRVARV